MSEDLYETCQVKCSQGDIVELLPHIYLNEPLLMLHAQGDEEFRASEDLAGFNDKKGQPIVAGCRRRAALVLSNDCEIDKPEVSRLLICPVHPISELSGTLQDRVRKNSVFAVFHLPKYRDGLAESYVDFKQISTVNRGFVQSGNRLCSLSDLGRRGLYKQFTRFLTRWQLAEIGCPHCGTVFDPALVLPVRSPD